jgi:hypothetical protein
MKVLPRNLCFSLHDKQLNFLTYRVIVNNFGYKKLVYFRNGYRYINETSWKQQGNSSFRSWDWLYNISAARGAPITVKENGVSRAKCLNRISRTYSLTPKIPGPHSMQLLPVGICQRQGRPASDAALPSRANVIGHSQRQWAKVAT